MGTLPKNEQPRPSRSSEDLWAGLSFVSLLVLAALFGYALTLSPAPGSFGIPHPDFQTMLRGGSGAARHGEILWLAWAVGAAEILFCGALMALGARRGPSLGGDRSRGGLRGLGWPMLIGLLAHVAAWTALVLSYSAYLIDPEPGLILALPAPTATMLYLMWALPLIFTVLYVAGFRRWVFSHADEAAFAELVERRRAAAKAGE